ncbi:MAG: MerR family transcriptional regulator [Deltaproteobacteria bacterium]|nr:MerR family transcriptional regulator [Deltaproteobacteria bacterium]
MRKISYFTTNDVYKLTRVSPRKLRWWDEQGLIKPGAFPSRKSGQRRRYTLRDIICILVIKTLRDNGMSLQKIREAVAKIEINGIDHPLAKLRVACLAHTIIVKIEGKYLEPLSGQMVIEQCLEEIRPQLERRRLAPAERAVERVNIDYEKKIAGF